MIPKRKVLFLFTGNSCRSQMAEAIVNARLGDDWDAFSAETHPTGYIHSNALAVLDEISIKHNGHSKHVDELREMHFDAVVTMCASNTKTLPYWSSYAN